jgi:hypothetical protein
MLSIPVSLLVAVSLVHLARDHSGLPQPLV